MNLWQAFKMAFKSIAMKKMRSFLTMLGIIIGVASVVIMVSVVQGQNKIQMEYWEKMGDNKIEVSAYSYYDNNDIIAQGLYDYCLTLGDYILGITPDVELGNKMTIQYGAKSLSVNDWESMWGSGGSVAVIGGGGAWVDPYESMLHVKLGSEQYGACNNYTLAGGREFSYLEIEKVIPVCVLGAGAKQQLFDYTDPVGETITINGDPFLVVGWYNSFDLDGYSGSRMDNVVILPYTFNRTMNDNNPINSYVVKAKSATATTIAMTKLKAYLQGIFPVNEYGYCDTGSFGVYSDTNYVNEMQSASLMQSLVLGAIAGISLLVGGIGIMNIMLVTVTERTREIGIRKAIGAERKSIITQFLIEAAMICSIGGLLGIGIGYVGTMIAGKLMEDVFQGMLLLPDMSITIGAFVFSVVLGIIFGMYPAIKASGLQPVEALRAE